MDYRLKPQRPRSGPHGYTCPVCETPFKGKEPNYCPDCGQALDWPSLHEPIDNTLKPCPFCGSPAEMYVIDRVPYGHFYIPRCTVTSCFGRLEKRRCTTKEEATRRWNKRAKEEER